MPSSFGWFHSCRAGDDGGRPAEVSVEKKVNLSTSSGAFSCYCCEKKIHHNGLEFTC